MAELWTLLTENPATFKGGGIWRIMTNINDALTAIAYGLLVLFFAAGIIKTCGSFTDLKKPEHVLKAFIRFALAQGAITYGMELMQALFSIVQGIVTTVMSGSSMAGSVTELPTEIVDKIESVGMLESIPLWIVTLLGSLLITVLSFAYTSVIQQYASQYGIPEYVSAIQAIMMQESGGRGTDPMQCSESPYNTRFPHTPGSITDPDYSIEVGVQTFADCIRQAGCSSPQDLDKLKLAWQGYNYGNGYIGWALQRGGYTEANALQFSQEQAASHGWSSYGDPQYVPHVMRYYSGGSLFAGLFGNQQIVSVAMGQLGNSGGQKFWSWYGFDSRVEWCACFVSWCADQSGLIASGNVPKFSLCSDGVSWFQGKNKWQSGGTTPTAGMIIFFDWDHDGTSDHVGIVEKCEGGRVYTIEGNSSDQVRQRNYAVDYSSIMGYGVLH